MLFLSTSNPPNTSYSWGIKGLCPMLSASLLNAFGFRHCTRALAVRSRHPSYKSTEGLRLVLYFAFNRGIRINLTTVPGEAKPIPGSARFGFGRVLEVDALISKQCEINFRVESVDADDFYSHGVAEAKFAAVAASLNDVFLLVIVIVVVRQCRKADKALDKIGVQFYEEA